MNAKGIFGSIVSFIVVIGIVILGFVCTEKIPTGYVGVVYNMSGGGQGYLMAGDVMFEDRDGSGYINKGDGTVDNPGDMMIIGNSLPRYNYSFRFDINCYPITL